VRWGHGKELERALAEASEIRKKNAQLFRESVVRQVRAGLTDWQIAKLLRTSPRKVRQVREARGLPPNTAGGAR
jgi:hypothetical protein